jgi:hypothetical protein
MQAHEEPPRDSPIPHTLLVVEGQRVHGIDFNTSGRSELGLFCGFGMLLWCITFRKAEKYLGKIGWFIALVALLLPAFQPAIN